MQWVDTNDIPPRRTTFTAGAKLRTAKPRPAKSRWRRLEIARLDNDPSQPENGKIQFFMEGGL